MKKYRLSPAKIASLFTDLIENEGIFRVEVMTQKEISDTVEWMLDEFPEDYL